MAVEHVQATRSSRSTAARPRSRSDRPRPCPSTRGRPDAAACRSCSRRGSGSRACASGACAGTGCATSTAPSSRSRGAAVDPHLAEAAAADLPHRRAAARPWNVSGHERSALTSGSSSSSRRSCGMRASSEPVARTTSKRMTALVDGSPPSLWRMTFEPTPNWRKSTITSTRSPAPSGSPCAGPARAAGRRRSRSGSCRARCRA